MKKFVIALLSSLASFTTNGQHMRGYRDNIYFDVAVSASSKQLATALSATHFSSGIRKIPNLQLGYGLRFTTFVGANQYYTTAPSKYTSPIQNPGTIFSRTLEENIDTITTATSITHSLNAAFHIHYSFHRNLSAGFNIDLAGVSFGSDKKFNVISNVYDAGQSPVVAGSPTRFNVLLTSDNDIGSLNSEFYIQLMIGDRIGFRTGYTFLFSEYTTVRNLSFDQGRINNDRYRYKAGMILLGFSYRPFSSSM
jgi:hypothetical protein